MTTSNTTPVRSLPNLSLIKKGDDAFDPRDLAVNGSPRTIAKWSHTSTETPSPSGVRQPTLKQWRACSEPSPTYMARTTPTPVQFADRDGPL